jgi:hypothetical protein
VQLALLTAAVKLFVYKPQSDRPKDLVHKVLKWATEEVDNPDLRDRGFMYWRMLAINPSVAGDIVLAEKPAITTDSDRMDRGALDQLLLHTGTLSSIYHKNPETFIRNATGKALADSPALNAHSRAVLIPLTQTQLPHTTVIVPGPGPTESHSAQSGFSTKDNPDLPEAVPSKEPRLNQEEDEDPGSDQDEGNVKPSGKQDPYSNLDGAFGNYLADEPQPIAASNRAGRHGDLDDLLF